MNNQCNTKLKEEHGSVSDLVASIIYAIMHKVIYLSPNIFVISHEPNMWEKVKKVIHIMKDKPNILHLPELFSHVNHLLGNKDFSGFLVCLKKTKQIQEDEQSSPTQ